MKKKQILYEINLASELNIYSHLFLVNKNFSPPLETRVNIKDYSRKIFEKATRFEAWDNGILVGLIAVYFNNSKEKIGFITNVSILKSHMRQGISSSLINMVILYGKKENFVELKLEVLKNNSAAINLYNKFGFVESYQNKELITMVYKLI